MPTLISCPMCGLEGELPDDLAGGLIACPRCNGHFAPSVGVPTVTLSSGVGAGASADATVSSGRPTAPVEADGMSVYVGSERVPVAVNTPPPARSLSPDLGPYAVRQPEGWDDPGVEVAEVNRKLASFESIKYFRLLPGELSEAAGELTPSLKIKRKVVEARYGDLIEEMYT